MWPLPFLEVVDLASLAAKPTSYGAPLLAPTPGRLGTTEAGTFHFDGREHRMAHARHGFFRTLPWHVVARTPASITCALEVRPQASLGSFPFELHAEHHVTIVDDGRLDAHVDVRSTGGADQPISLGWHPYLQRDPGCRLHIPASAAWELDDSPEPVPSGRIQPVSGRSDFREGREIAPGEHWDLTLTDLTADADGLMRAWLESEVAVLGADGSPRRVRIRREMAAPLGPGETGGFSNVQLYTTPGRSAVAVEPFSSPPNALNLPEPAQARSGVRRLHPGESVRFSMQLRLVS